MSLRVEFIDTVVGFFVRLGASSVCFFGKIMHKLRTLQFGVNHCGETHIEICDTEACGMARVFRDFL